MSLNESELHHFPEASTAELRPHATASSQPSNSPSPMMQAGTWA
ncbi:hypothetical protein [Candidatus Binatus sp.]